MKNYTNKSMNKGFTLIELLVVVAIIAILATIGLVIFSGAQANARDARRKSDIDAIANALESTRTPGTGVYNNVTAANFSSGAIPADTTPAKYCITTSTTTTAIAAGEPSAWTTSSACPTGTAANWTGTIGGVFTGTLPQSNVTYWKVCALLESTQTAPATQWYCKSSGQ